MTDRGCLGEVLKELRLERGMSLRALGERAGLSPGYLSALELGRQKNPSLEALCGIAEALGVSITVSCDEPGYIRVSEGSPPCVSFVRSGVPTVREEIEEAKEEAADWRTTDDASLWPTRASVDDITALRGRLGPTPWHQMYQGVPPERGQHEDWDAMKAEMDKDPEQRAMWNSAWRSAPFYESWKAVLADLEAPQPPLSDQPPPSVAERGLAVAAQDLRAAIMGTASSAGSGAVGQRLNLAVVAADFLVAVLELEVQDVGGLPSDDLHALGALYNAAARLCRDSGVAQDNVLLAMLLARREGTVGDRSRDLARVQPDSDGTGLVGEE